MDVHPSENIFRELQQVLDTGFYGNGIVSPEDHWHQVQTAFIIATFSLDLPNTKHKKQEDMMTFHVKVRWCKNIASNENRYNFQVNIILQIVTCCRHCTKG